MPFYAYACGACGPFEEFRAIARFSEPCECPGCGHPAPRQLSMAALGTGASAAAAPLAASRPHRVGCGCCTPVARQGLKADAATLGAPKRGPKAASASFLDRP